MKLFGENLLPQVDILHVHITSDAHDAVLWELGKLKNHVLTSTVSNLSVIIVINEEVPSLRVSLYLMFELPSFFRFSMT